MEKDFKEEGFIDLPNEDELNETKNKKFPLVVNKALEYRNRNVVFNDNNNNYVNDDKEIDDNNKNENIIKEKNDENEELKNNKDKEKEKKLNLKVDNNIKN